MTSAAHQEQVAGGGLLHPAPLTAVAVLVINDHFAKAHWPGLLTGKLSDIAGLVFFPLALQAAWELAHAALGLAWRPSTRVLISSALITAAVFALVKTWAPANECYRVLFGVARWPIDATLALLEARPWPAVTQAVLIADRTDLLALPASLVALTLSRGAGAREWFVGSSVVSPQTGASDDRPAVRELSRRHPAHATQRRRPPREQGGLRSAPLHRG